MKKVQNTLISIADALQKLSKQFKAASKELDKLKKASKKKAKATTAKKTVKSKAKAVAKKTKKKATAPKKTAKSKAASASSVIDAVFTAIKKTRKGITISEIKAKTKLESRQISNAVYKLSKRGQIKTTKRGVYVKK
jgi:replication protein A-like